MYVARHQTTQKQIALIFSQVDAWVIWSNIYIFLNLFWLQPKVVAIRPIVWSLHYFLEGFNLFIQRNIFFLLSPSKRILVLFTYPVVHGKSNQRSDFTFQKYQ